MRDENRLLLFHHDPQNTIGKWDIIMEKGDQLYCRIRLNKQGLKHRDMIIRFLQSEGMMPIYIKVEKC